jgi:hypothetical protein
VSVQTYPYEAHFKWKWHKDVDVWAIENKETVSAKLQADFKTAFLAQFAETLSAEGHWYRLDDVVTNITDYRGGYTFGFPVPGYAYDVEGETVIFFQSDIKDASAHNSPQLWQVVQDAIWSVIHYLALHPGIVVAIVALGILTILSIWLINTGTGAILSLGSNVGSALITLGILVVVGLGIYALFFSKGGRKAGRKTYQVGRRAYRAVRRRT